MTRRFMVLFLIPLWSFIDINFTYRFYQFRIYIIYIYKFIHKFICVNFTYVPLENFDKYMTKQNIDLVILSVQSQLFCSYV